MRTERKVGATVPATRQAGGPPPGGRRLVAAAVATAVLGLVGCADDGPDGSASPSTGAGPASTAPEALGDPADLTVPDPLPSADDLEPAEPPETGFVFIGATAEVAVGGRRRVLSGRSHRVLDHPHFHSTGPDAEYAAACNAIATSDDAMTVGVDLYRATGRNLADSFSFAHDGETAVVWGFHDAGSGEEWSAHGTGRTAITVGTVDGLILLDSRVDDDFLLVVVEFSGTATENLSSERSPASSTIWCAWISERLADRILPARIRPT